MIINKGRCSKVSGSGCVLSAPFTGLPDVVYRVRTETYRRPTGAPVTGRRAPPAAEPPPAREPPPASALTREA